MKQKLTILLAIVCLVVAGPRSVSAQDYIPTPVTVSKDKVRLGGRLYYSHVVLEKQTLYSISKAYGVSIDEIIQSNAGIQADGTGLQKNAIIMIPVPDAKDAKDVQTVAEPEPQPQPAEDTPEYKIHTVKWFEDIDDIAKTYGVSVKDIMDYNGLTSRKLSKRQKIKIPLVPVQQAAPQPQVETPPAPPATVDEPEPEPKEEAAPVVTTPEVPSLLEDFVEGLMGKKTVNVALLLPLGAKGSVNSDFMDFYCGVLLAVKDLEEQGIGTNLSVYDVAGGAIPSRDALVSNDLVLGPVTEKDLTAVLDRVNGRTAVISPLEQKAEHLAGSCSNFVQAPTSNQTQYDDLIAWAESETAPADKVLLITEKGRTSPAFTGITSALSRRNLRHSTISYSIIEGRKIPSTMPQYLTKQGVNRIIVATESEAFMGDVMRNIGIIMDKGYNVVMYAPSKLRTFDTIDGTGFHNANLHISSSYSIDYSLPEVDRFVKAYRALYNTEPNGFSFQGYDTARFFISKCSKYGNRWMKKVPGETESLLHADFRMEATESGALVNRAVRRTVYDKDFSTHLVK